MFSLPRHQHVGMYEFLYEWLWLWLWFIHLWSIIYMIIIHKLLIYKWVHYIITCVIEVLEEYFGWPGTGYSAAGFWDQTLSTWLLFYLSVFLVQGMLIVWPQYNFETKLLNSLYGSSLMYCEGGMPDYTAIFQDTPYIQGIYINEVLGWCTNIF